MPPAFRRFLFRLHLVLGIAAAAIILVVAATGVALALESPVIHWLERHERRVTPPSPTATHAPVSLWMDAIALDYPEHKVSGIQVFADREAAALVMLGKNQSCFVNPYTGAVAAPSATGAREFFKLMLTWHRWLGVPAPAKGAADAPAAPAERNWRDFAGTAVGLASATLLVLAVSGIALWLPRHFTRSAWKFATTPRLQSPGHVTYGNWHRVAGFWMFPGIVMLATTGVVMAFKPVGDAVAKRPDPAVANAIAGLDPRAQRAEPDELLDTLRDRFPHAESYTLNLAPPKGRQPGASKSPPSGITASITEPGPWPIATQVLLHPVSADIVRVTPPGDLPLRQQLRALARPLHTGLWAGSAGLAFVAATALAVIVLTLTGLALSWRRYRQKPRQSR